MKAAYLLAAIHFSVASAQTPPEPAASAPVPDAEARKKARALVFDIFKAELASKAADKRARLAATLLEQARKSGGDAALMFVLLQESAAVAAGVGEADTALRALEELSERFRIDMVEEKGPVLEKLSFSARTAEAHVRIAEEALAVSDAALAADAFDQAMTFTSLAERSAGRAKDVALAADARRQRESVGAARTRFGKVAKFAEALARNPADPDANLEMGKYACFAKGDWAVGLPRLAKGSDAALQALAKASLTAGDDPLKVAEAASGWWDASTKMTALERDAVRLHASERYRAVVADLTGLHRLKAEKRIGEAEALSAARTGGGKIVDLVKLIEVSKDAVHGKWKVEKNVLHCESGGLVPRVHTPYQPPAEYDFVVTFSQERLRNGVSLIMPNRNGETFYWCVGSRRGAEHGLSVDGKNVDVKLPMGREVKAGTYHTAVVQVRRNEVRALLDGKEVLRRKTDFKDLKTDGWRKMKDNTVLSVACDDPTVFTAVRVIEIRGTGKRVR